MLGGLELGRGPVARESRGAVLGYEDVARRESADAAVRCAVVAVEARKNELGDVVEVILGALGQTSGVGREGQLVGLGAVVERPHAECVARRDCLVSHGILGDESEVAEEVADAAFAASGDYRRDQIEIGGRCRCVRPRLEIGAVVEARRANDGPVAAANSFVGWDAARAHQCEE